MQNDPFRQARQAFRYGRSERSRREFIMALQGLSMDPEDRDDNHLMGIPDRYVLPTPVTIPYGPMIRVDNTHTSNRNTMRGIDVAGMAREDLRNPRVIERRVNREYQHQNLMAAIRQAEGALNRHYNRNIFSNSLRQWF